MASSIKVIDGKCVGCKLCVKACPFGAIVVENKLARIDYAKCTLCGACFEACKFSAIDYRKDTSVSKDLSGYKDVWVFAEQTNGVIQSVTYELLGEGHKLAGSLGMSLCAVLIGSGIKARAEDLILRGAQKVYVIDNPGLGYFRDEPYAAVLIDLVNRHKPNILLCGATTIGRSLISRVAVSINAGLTADCTGLAIDPETKNLLQTRPAFGGNIMATIITPNHRPQMSTVRHKVMREAVVDTKRKGEIVVEEIAKALLGSRTERLGFEAEAGTTVNIADADIIVSGGRGMQSAANFAILRELARSEERRVGKECRSRWSPYH